MPRLHVLAVSAAALVLLTISLSGAGAQQSQLERQVPASPAQLQLSFAPIVQRVAPAVVNVYAAKRVVQNNNPLSGRSDLPPVLRRARPAPADAALAGLRRHGGSVGPGRHQRHVIEGADAR
jgi:S1-C subfamily serine protease